MQAGQQLTRNHAVAGAEAATLTMIWTVLKETVSEYIADGALSKGAAIAFYTILSLGPVLLICIAIAGLVFGQAAAQVA